MYLRESDMANPVNLYRRRNIMGKNRRAHHSGDLFIMVDCRAAILKGRHDQR
jgi:hypothetical protein